MEDRADACPMYSYDASEKSLIARATTFLNAAAEPDYQWAIEQQKVNVISTMAKRT